MATYDLQAIKEAFPPVRVLEHFGLDLGRDGRRSCPLCGASRRDTLSVRADLWHCFACSRGGDSIMLYEALASVTRGQAIRALAGMAGLADATPADVAAFQARAHFARAQRWAREELTRQARRKRDAIEARWHWADYAAHDYGRAAGAYWRAGDVDSALDALARAYRCRRVAGDALAALPVA